MIGAIIEIIIGLLVWQVVLGVLLKGRKMYAMLLN